MKIHDHVEEEELLDRSLRSVLALEEAAQKLDLEESVVERLRHAEREITLHLPLTAVDGRPATVTGLRVQHSTARGPTMGFVRISPEATLSWARAAAMSLTWQLALLDLPFGGSAGAIVCDPELLKEHQLRSLVREYVQGLYGMLGPRTDIVMPENGADERLLAWVLDAYTQVAGHVEPAMVLGKPAWLFGIGEYARSVAAGAVAQIGEALLGQRKSVAGLRFAVQGFERIPKITAGLLQEQGARLLAVADHSGGLLAPNGMGVAELDSWTSKQGALLGCPAGEAVSNADVLAAGCDLLIVADGEAQLTPARAGAVRTAMVVELAFDAATAGAEQALQSRGIAVVPWLLASAGGAAHAYAEWLVDTGGRMLTAQDPEEQVKRRVIAAYRGVADVARRQQLSLRQAAELRALDLVSAAVRLRE